MTVLDRRSFLATTAGAALMTAAPALAQGSEDAKLRTLLDKIFEDQVDDSPERATGLGLDKGARAALKSQLDERSAAAREARLAKVKARVAALNAIDRKALSPASKVDLDVVLYQNSHAVSNGEAYRFGAVGGRFSPYVISQQNGAYQDIPDFLDNQHRVATSADADAWISRLHAFGKVLDQDLDRMKADVAAGVVPPDFICDLTLAQLRALRDQPPEKTVLVSSLAAKARAAGLTADYATPAAKIVAEEIYPALDRQIAAVQANRAIATSEAGVGRLKNAAQYYADACEASTTTTMTPQEIHQLGLDQVADITARLDTILKSQGMTQGTVAERLNGLNNDPSQLYANTDAGRAELIAALNVQIAEVYKTLPLAFDTLPKAKVEVTVVSCFSIGLGAGLTPLGEPLSTIVISKLSGAPYYAGFSFLFDRLALFIIPAVLALGVVGVVLFSRSHTGDEKLECIVERETLSEIFLRAGKVWLFIMALVFLGEGFKPLILQYIINIPSAGLYWINIVSAVLDNATLAAAEISPALSAQQITSALMGLLIAGGMLIPGNIPNIIAACKLGITSSEWAKIGLPLGLALMAVFFVILFVPGWLGFA